MVLIRNLFELLHSTCRDHLFSSLLWQLEQHCTSWKLLPIQCYWEREGYSYGSKWKAHRNLLRVLQEDAQQGVALTARIWRSLGAQEEKRNAVLNESVWSQVGPTLGNTYNLLSFLSPSDWQTTQTRWNQSHMWVIPAQPKKLVSSHLLVYTVYIWD